MPQTHSIDTLAAVIGTCGLVLFAIWLSTLVGTFLTVAIGVAFFLSGRQRHLFALVAWPLRPLLGVRAEEEGVDAGFRRGRLEPKPGLPVVIDHDPNEFTSKRG